MNIELQKELFIVLIDNEIAYTYIIRSNKDYNKLATKYDHEIYKIKTISIKEFEKIDRTIFKVYDYKENFN